MQKHKFILILFAAILLGGITGVWLGPKAIILKPLGDIFLNLLFTAVIPLVFFSVASAIASIGEVKRIEKIIGFSFLTFLFTSLVAAFFMLAVVTLFPLGKGISLPLIAKAPSVHLHLADQIVNMFTVNDFVKLFSRDNMLAIIFFSFLVGIATASCKEKGKVFAAFLESGKEIFIKIISLIMYYAPIGFFAYFAVLISQLGPKIVTIYFHAISVYYIAAIIYFVIGLSFFAFIAGKWEGVKTFWKHISLPAMIAIGTCSSSATIPANLEASKKMNVSDEVRGLVIPLGTMIHKDGSVLGAMLKISFLFGIFHLTLADPSACAIAVVVALLVGSVMAAVPSGGAIGEMLILSVYGFPPELVFVISVIAMVIDPIATTLNATTNTVCSMLVNRLISENSDLVDYAKNANSPTVSID